MRVADFFCGAGGFSEGFRQAGCEIVFAIDNWETAVKTYRQNKSEFPNLKIICDDVIKISELSDIEFDRTVPDSEIIIGSPPCVAFSNSNKSGNGDKTLGMALLKAYLRIVARKMYKENSVLQYWILENVPNIEKFIQSEYSADELGLNGDFVLKVKGESSGIYNAKYFGAPTNRIRYLCGNFPTPLQTCNEATVKTLGMVLGSLGPTVLSDRNIIDCNYPELVLNDVEVTDHFYQMYLAEFEWTTAKRLKQDRGYMGVMSFPENIYKPARTVMATMSSSSREAMILLDENGYRLPTVREVASMMSFPIDYRFYGSNVSNKYKMVGNSVPPKLSYALAIAILDDVGLEYHRSYHRIVHLNEEDFINLNGRIFPIKKEKTKNFKTKFKYHIPYIKIKSYRVELTNHHSKFVEKEIIWSAEIHYSQGKQAKIYSPKCDSRKYNKLISNSNRVFVDRAIEQLQRKYKYSFNRFHENYRMTIENRIEKKVYGPFELLNDIKIIIDSLDFTDDLIENLIPTKIYVGYYILDKVLKRMVKLKK